MASRDWSKKESGGSIHLSPVMSSCQWQICALPRTCIQHSLVASTGTLRCTRIGPCSSCWNSTSICLTLNRWVTHWQSICHSARCRVKWRTFLSRDAKHSSGLMAGHGFGSWRLISRCLQYWKQKVGNRIFALFRSCWLIGFHPGWIAKSILPVPGRTPIRLLLSRSASSMHKPVIGLTSIQHLGPLPNGFTVATDAFRFAWSHLGMISFRRSWPRSI